MEEVQEEVEEELEEDEVQGEVQQVEEVEEEVEEVQEEVEEEVGLGGGALHLLIDLLVLPDPIHEVGEGLVGVSSVLSVRGVAR